MINHSFTLRSVLYVIIMCGNVENTTSYREGTRAVSTFTCIHQVLCRPIQWIRSYFTIAMSCNKFTAKMPLASTLSHKLQGYANCTLIYYKYYHHSCFGLCCGPHDKECCDCILTLLRLSQLDITSLSSSYHNILLWGHPTHSTHAFTLERIGDIKISVGMT